MTGIDVRHTLNPTAIARSKSCVAAARAAVRRNARRRSEGFSIARRKRCIVSDYQEGMKLVILQCRHQSTTVATPGILGHAMNSAIHVDVVYRRSKIQAY